MSTESWQTAAVVVMVASLPLLAWGGNDEAIPAAVAGGAVFTIGAMGLTALRFTPSKEE